MERNPLLEAVPYRESRCRAHMNIAGVVANLGLPVSGQACGILLTEYWTRVAGTPAPPMHCCHPPYKATRPSFRKSPQARAPAVQLGGLKLVLGQIIGQTELLNLSVRKQASARL